MEKLDLLQPEGLPEGNYRIIQIYIDSKPYIYMADAHVYARDILAAILELHKLDYKIVQLCHNRGPAPRGEKYTVCGIGGATCMERDGRKSITLFGDSVDYDLPISKAPLELIKEKYPDVEFLVTDYR